MLDHSHLKIEGQIAPGRFGAGPGYLLFSWINAKDAAPNALLSFDGQGSCSAAHIQHRFSRAEVSQIDGSLSQLPQLASEQEGVAQPFSQIVAQTRVQNQPFCLVGRLFAGCGMEVTCQKFMHRSCSFQRNPLCSSEDTACVNRGAISRFSSKKMSPLW